MVRAIRTVAEMMDAKIYIAAFTVGYGAAIVLFTLSITITFIYNFVKGVFCGRNSKKH